MATILLQAAGGFLGGLLGPAGSAIGTAVGALAGYAVDRALLSGTRRIEGPRLSGPRPFTAEDGASLPRVYGTARVGGTLIWATRFEETRQTRRGAKGGPRVTEYSYFANVAFALAEGQVAGVRRVWADGRELDRTQVEMRFYQGTAAQAVDPLIAAKQGSGNAPAYRDTAYVVFERFALGDYGNRIPQFQFEVLRPVGRVAKNIRGVALIPGSTEFGLSPAPVTREIREGETDHLNRHVLYAGTDFMASLDELHQLCPGLEHVALVVTWFGNDLRAGNCLIRPAVIDNGPAGFSSQWRVSGLTRADAPVVSYHEGGAAYGGSPSDRSVIEAIAEIKQRGLKVTLYPFVMMDVPHGNALPDPYGGGAGQAPYPWRGRVTCNPAPGVAGTADKTAAARAQVDALVGGAAVGDFSVADDTIAFSGNPADWGYRRLVLHYAHLAVAAGGVDAFLIGSELRGLTTLRDDADAFPFVEALCDLAADVRTTVGGATKISYGADWSEYFGHQPADGSSDVFFHLDPLWAHPAIDAVGIDNYMPLSDWRDADHLGGNPDGFAGPYDPDGLRNGIASGEGFDWFYPSPTVREGRLRTAITDGAYGKPWVFRYKDIVSWWSNAHYNRIGGVEAGSPTAWAPRSKPIWLTEVGCPAVDKGPNQPNVFPDPKSSENASPHFSSGGRSDLAQHRYLEAHLDHWDPASPHFLAAGNPVSPVYGSHMVDPDRIYAWAWDARPFPIFPQQASLWRDGGNWNLGHWLNGRLGGVAVGDLINAILADHGLPAADVRQADGTMQGYVIEDPCSARAAIEPVLDLYGIGAREEGGSFVFAREGATAIGARPVTEMVVADDRPVVELVRSPDQDLPAEAVLGFRDPFAEYQTASARHVRLGAGGERQEQIGFPGVLEPDEADALLADWMQRKWRQRERATFAPSETAVAPGAVLSLPGAVSGTRFLVDEVEEGLVKTVSAREIVGSATARRRSVKPVPPSPPPIFGKPQAIFLDLPMVPGGEEHNQFRAALWAKPWKSQALYASPETTGFTLRAIAPTPAFLGRLTAPLAAGFHGRIDRTHAIMVEVHSGELASVSRAQLLNGANAAAIRSTSGIWEVVQFETAEEVSPSLWKLTGLLRGQLGTDDAMLAGAATGADFVVLDEAVKPAGLLASETGLALNWRVGPSGQDFSAAAFSQQTVTGGLRARTPLSPVHLKAKWLAGGDVAISWIRRGRIDADGWDGDDIPVGEESESYRVEVVTDTGTVRRTVTVGTQSWTYPAAAVAVDFPALPATVAIAVRQLSAVAGAGIAAQLEIELA